MSIFTQQLRHSFHFVQIAVRAPALCVPLRHDAISFHWRRSYEWMLWFSAFLHTAAFYSVPEVKPALYVRLLNQVKQRVQSCGRPTRVNLRSPARNASVIDSPWNHEKELKTKARKNIFFWLFAVKRPRFFTQALSCTRIHMHTDSSRMW